MSSSAYITQVQLIGRTGGLVKTLKTFDKKRHDAPDAVNPATQAFLARLCAPELAGEAESLFQRVRAALGYKRKDIALDVTAPLAVLTARDFTCEMAYSLCDDSPAEYLVTRTLHTLRHGELLHLDEFDTLFAGQFSTISFTLRRGVRVETVIDAIEALDSPASALRVDYPSDCSHCVLTVRDVEAEVICDGATLEMRFPRSSSPRELITAFAAVRAAFQLTADTALAGLL